MEGFNVEVRMATEREDAIGELGELEDEWARVPSEGMEGRDAVDEDGDSKDGKVDREEEPQRYSDGGGADRGGREKRDSGGREEKERSMDRDRVRLLAAEDLVGDLGRPAGCIFISRRGCERQDTDAPRQTRRSERHPPQMGPNGAFRCWRSWCGPRIDGPTHFYGLLSGAGAQHGCR